MIVLSILTALGLERAAVAWQDHTAGQESRAHIEDELARNARDIRSGLAGMSAADARITAAVDQLVGLVKSNPPLTDADAHKKAETILRGLHGDVMLAFPSWQHNAWDSAIADQSATHLPLADLRRYAEIYAAAHDMTLALQMLASGDLIEMSARTSLDLRLGEVTPRSAAQMLLRFQIAAQPLASDQRKLLALIGTSGEDAPGNADAGKPDH